LEKAEDAIENAVTKWGRHLASGPCKKLQALAYGQLEIWAKAAAKEARSHQPTFSRELSDALSAWKSLLARPLPRI
jgi:hypothetical protein